MGQYKEGKIIKATVTGIENYGIFVSLNDYYTGLIHISEISTGFVKNIHDIVKIGETIYVKVLDIDEKNNHLILSIKNIKYKMNTKQEKKKIVETPLGFTTLRYELPQWIDKNIKKREIV